MNLPVIILGAGGHAKVLIDTLLRNSVSIIGLTDMKEETFGGKVVGFHVIGPDDELLQYPPESVQLVNGLGSTNATGRRKLLYEKFKQMGYSFLTVIHPSAIIAHDVHLAEGVQVMAGAIIQTESAVGENSIINTRATIEHDCVIGPHVHIAPGATISGGAVLGQGTFIGVSATVIQNIRIGEFATIAAGAIIIKNIPAGATAMGVPANVFEKNERLEKNPY